MSVQLSQTLDYESKDLEASSYSHMKLVPLSGAQTSTVSPNSGNDVTFEIPVQAINMARSYFYADVSVAAQGGLAIWKHEGIAPFSSMQIFTRGGQYLLNLQERATDYSRVVISADSSEDELKNGDVTGPLYRSGISTTYGEDAAVNSDAPYFGQKVTNVGVAGAALTYRVIFPLKALKASICAVDKSILYREVLVCKFKLAPGVDVCFAATDAVDPTTAVAITSNMTYSNMALYVAQERNSNVVQSLNASTESEGGFSLLCGYPTTFTNQRSAATQQNVTLRLNKSHGSSLKAIKHCVFANADNNRRYDRDNTSQAKVTSFVTNLNNNRMTEFDIDCAAQLDYMNLKKKLDGSPAVNASVFNKSWFHEDRFDDYADVLTDLKTVDTNILSGINLNEEIRWDIYCRTVNAAHRHFSIIHGQKLLNINSRGLVIG